MDTSKNPRKRGAAGLSPVTTTPRDGSVGGGSPVPNRHAKRQARDEDFELSDTSDPTDGYAGMGLTEMPDDSSRRAQSTLHPDGVSRQADLNRPNNVWYWDFDPANNPENQAFQPRPISLLNEAFDPNSLADDIFAEVAEDVFAMAPGAVGLPAAHGHALGAEAMPRQFSSLQLRDSSPEEGEIIDLTLDTDDEDAHDPRKTGHSAAAPAGAENARPRSDYADLQDELEQQRARRLAGMPSLTVKEENAREALPPPLSPWVSGANAIQPGDAGPDPEPEPAPVQRSRKREARRAAQVGGPPASYNKYNMAIYVANSIDFGEPSIGNRCWPWTLYKDVFAGGTVVRSIHFTPTESLTDEHITDLISLGPATCIHIEDFYCKSPTDKPHKLSDTAVIGLVKACPNLKQLCIIGAQKLTNKSMDAIFVYCPSLRYLDLSMVPKEGGNKQPWNALHRLAMEPALVPNLRKLVMRNCNALSDGDMRSLTRTRENLEIEVGPSRRAERVYWRGLSGRNGRWTNPGLL